MGCFFVTTYMANSQISRWLENNDESTITFKKFNLSPKDIYPEISICFTGHRLNWYNDDSISDKFGITTEDYEKMLKGSKLFSYNYNFTSKLYDKVEIKDKYWLMEGVEQFQIKASTLITGLQYENEDKSSSIIYGKGKDGRSVVDIPLHPSFKTPDTICFTRTATDASGTLRVYDLIAFNRSILAHHKYENVEFQIFIHHPQQLLRSFHRPAFKSTFGYMREPNVNNNNPWTKFLRIALSKVTVLRKRPGSNVPCDKGLTDDDTRLQNEIIDHIQCIPIYWKYNTGANLNIKICNTSEDLKRAQYYIENYKMVFGAYTPPCMSSEVWSKFDKEEENESEDPMILFRYTESVYQEIANTENFGFESFISGVGGFVGIFLGYSILQLPELMTLIPSFLQKLSNFFTKGMQSMLVITNVN